MDTTDHSLKTLFDQLGLPSDDQAIEQFVHTHKLGPGTALIKAPFWNDGQRAFLTEELEEDADWAELVDHLDAMLRR